MGTNTKKKNVDIPSQKNMENYISIQLLIAIFFILIIFIFSQIQRHEVSQNNRSLKSLAILGQNFLDTYQTLGIYNINNNKDRDLFPLCKDADEVKKNNSHCRHLTVSIFDQFTGSLLLESRGEGRLYPNAEQIPQTCGFGKLVYNSREKSWECMCHAPLYFNGNHCDEPQPILTQTNKCSVVAESTNLSNRDISTFNPFLEGVCVECSVPNAVPILTALEPLCEEVNKKRGETTIRKYRENPCFYNALNPQADNNSPFNKFVEGYGCVCDYQNGFIEVQFEGYSRDNGIVSDACIKFGQTTDGGGEDDGFHRADIAYYSFQNSRIPIQVHSYTELESPFSNIFKGKKEILVKQPALDIVHSEDWLNRNIKATKTEKIRRLNYPHEDWPIVDKIRLVNSYQRRLETSPVDAYTLAMGRGFETKHWYETTNNRWLSNSVWGHPIVYTYLGGDTPWYGRVTLNPIGVELGWYYGVTIKTKPGEIVRLDTRGYEQEEEKEVMVGKKSTTVVTLPPSYKHEMMDPKSIIYVPLLYTHYVFDK